jgi:hypothetical protein
MMMPRRGLGTPPPASPVTDLLVAILWKQPRMPGASCRAPENRAVFDAANGAGLGRSAPAARREARREAKALCGTCDALADCAAWIDGLRPSERPGGVAAGRVTSQWH